jgi:KDO2-lipid IV(A) lauroyltransferase
MYFLQTFSDLLYYIVYYIFPYRKKIVLMNLRNSFPDKTEEEILQISRKFFRFFCDLVTETIKGFTMSVPSLVRRFQVVNPELADKYFNQGKSVMFIGPHYGNHEWGKIIGLQMQHPLVVLYSTFSNPYVDQYLIRARVKYHIELVPVQKILRAFMERKNKPYGFILGVDQRPFDLNNALWVRFLNQDTPCHQGYEQIARKFDMPVVYVDIQVVKRGYYKFRTILLTEHPTTLPEGAIVKAFMKQIQMTIQARPEYWLWSHKRWKLKKPEGIEVESLD